MSFREFREKAWFCWVWMKIDVENYDGKVGGINWYGKKQKYSKEQVKKFGKKRTRRSHW